MVKLFAEHCQSVYLLFRESRNRVSQVVGIIFYKGINNGVYTLLRRLAQDKDV